MIPVGQFALALLHNGQLLLGIVDERAELLDLRLAELIAEYLAHLALDVARGIAQHMLKGFVLAVDVGQEVFRALW